MSPLFPHISSAEHLSFLSPPSPVSHSVSISVSVRGGCVSMATGFATGLWEVKECSSSKAKFICRQNQDPSLSPEPPGPQPTPSLSGSCPRGWKTNSNLRYCYKVCRLCVSVLTSAGMSENRLTDIISPTRNC